MQSANLAIEATVTEHGSILQLCGDDAPTMRRHAKEMHVNLEVTFTGMIILFTYIMPYILHKEILLLTIVYILVHL